MKRKALSIFFLMAAVSCLAQPKEYEPTINWPFLLNDFYNGTIVVGRDTVSRARLNFHLRAETLNCIDQQEKIARVLFSDISGVIINGEIYRFVDGKPMQQLYAEDDAMLMDYCYIDYDLMSPGYMQGMALYARATSDVATLANWNNFLNYKNIHMKGEFNESYAELRNNWFDGPKLPVKHTFYFVVNGKSFRAIASECNDQLSKEGQRGLRSLMKSKKLKWRDKEDLVTVLKYMKETMR